MNKMMMRLMAMLLAMCMTFGCVAFAEDELSFSDMGIEFTEEDEDLIYEDEETLFVSDELQSEIDLLDQDMEMDNSINPNDLELNPNLPDNVINILLIGVDTREASTTNDSTNTMRGDVMMILSIGLDDGSVKLTSILRDSYVAIPGYKNNNKINAAYGRGGGELAMRTVNHNFDMNIQYYVTINFYGLASIIDALGGVDVDLTKVEAGAINAYLKKHPPKYDNTDGKSRVKLEKKAGVQHLDGVQAVMYARLREIDNDFARTARQRHLLELLLKQVMGDMNTNKLLTLIQTVLPYVTTNINASTIFNLCLSVLQSDIMARAKNGDALLEQYRLPVGGSGSSEKMLWKYDTINGSSVVYISPNNMKKNTEALHNFIYGAYYPAK